MNNEIHSPSGSACHIKMWRSPHHDNELFMKLRVSICRSESPSSQRSSPPISPGCEDQMLDSHEPFKKPLPPMRPQEFPPFYGGYPYHLMQHGSSAFHRPIDASGKPLPVNILQNSFIILIESHFAIWNNAPNRIIV